MRFNIKHIVAKKGSVIIGLIILIASLLRLYKLPEYITFLGDQGRDAIIVRRILTLQHLPAIGASSSIGQIYLGPFYYYFIAPFLLLFNYNPAGLAYGVAIISIIGLILSFFIVDKLFGRLSSIIFLILLTFSSANITFSRYSWNPNLLPLFSFLSLYFFYKLEKKGKRLDAILFGSLLSFSIQLHYLAVFLLLPILFFMILKRSSIISKLSNYLLSAAAFAFFSLPLIIFDLRHNFLNTRNFIKLFFSNELVNKESILSRAATTNQNFFNHIFVLNINSFVAAALLAAMIFLYWKNSRKIDDFLKLNFLNLIFFLAGFSLLNSPRYAHYYGPIYYSFFLTIAFIMSRYQKKFLIKFLIIPLFFIFYFLTNLQGYYFLKNNPSNQINIAKTIAQSIINEKPQVPYQFISQPSSDTTGHVRYFLELSPYIPLDEDSPTQPKELYVLCYMPTCSVLGNPQWQIAAFKNKKLDKIWEIEGVKIYKLVHE